MFVFGGEGNAASAAGTFAENEAYDVDTDEWFAAEPMRLPRHGIGAGTIGNRIYIPGGGPVEGYSTTVQSDFFEVAQEIVLPQFVVGGGYRTEIVVSNPASRSADIQISISDMNGSDLITLLDGTSQAAVRLTVPSLATRTISAPDTSGALRAGTVRIRANVRLNAFAVVRGPMIPAATVYPVVPARTAMFQARLVRAEATNTGVVIANLGVESAQVMLALLNGSGTEIARIEQTVAGGGQLSLYIDQIFGL
jgi:hypothetical protein